MAYGIRLNVAGDYACFTRPEMKVERVSYNVMTPSAARGLLEAIHWKAAIRRVMVLASNLGSAAGTRPSPATPC
jgi:CRISPR-associated protein Cas5d